VNSARRRKARELLVQALYATEVGGKTLAEAVAEQAERRKPHPDALAYAREIADELAESLADLDTRIDAVLESRRPERVGAVERAILRLGLIELLRRPDVPIAVVIDEAMALARHFSTEDSARFVHGVLDKLGRTARPSSTSP
jgi:N utilization substance protein B